MADTEGNEAVGFGRPPKAHRFKPGQSGNPEGRPKRVRNLASDLQEELAEMIRIRESGRERRVSKQRAMVKSLVAAAVKGDVRATTALISLLARAVEDAVGNSNKEEVSPVDDQILKDFVDREIENRNNKPPKIIRSEERDHDA